MSSGSPGSTPRASTRCSTARRRSNAFNDYNFTTPNANLLTGTDTLFQMGGNEVFELFDYPGHYATRKEGEKLVDIRMEQEEVAHSTVQGGGRARTLASGFKFELADHPNALANGWYVVTSVSHQAEEAETFSGGKAAGEVYKNRFQCIPAQVVFRPPMVTPRPTVRGCQTAVVSGPAVEEIARDRHLHVKGKEAVKVDGTLSLKVGGDVVEVFDSNHSQQVTADHYLKARNIVIEADVNITIKVGQIHIVLTPEGIKLGAPTGKIKTQTGPMGTEMESTGPMSLKATPLKLN